MFVRPQFTLQARQFSLTLDRRTKIMGILNLTPDSFSKDGLLSSHRLLSSEKILKRAQEMVRFGADILDVGGESTRPGAEAISAQEEIKRIIPTIKLLVQKKIHPVSVDTYKPLVAQHALDAGVSIVNNVMGTKPNLSLLRMVRNYGAGIILMHSRKTPKMMQQVIRYKNVLQEILDELKRGVERCLDLNIKINRIVIDPGIGFAKTLEHNLEILHQLSFFQKLKLPILLGPSRKSFIGMALDRRVEQRLMGTAAAVSCAVINGAHIIRVHDVKQMRDVVDMTDAIIAERKLKT